MLSWRRVKRSSAGSFCVSRSIPPGTVRPHSRIDVDGTKAVRRGHPQRRGLASIVGRDLNHPCFVRPEHEAVAPPCWASLLSADPLRIDRPAAD